MNAWHDNVLFPAKPAGTESASFEKQILVAKYFGGSPRTEGISKEIVPPIRSVPTAPVAAPAVSIPTAPASSSQPRKKKEGC